MTRPEAEALVMRLEQIWQAAPLERRHHSWNWKDGEVEVVLDLPRRYRLRLGTTNGTPLLSATIEHRHFFLIMRLHASGEFEVYPHHRRKQILALPCATTFRRNFWLSGCAIECSAHEQMEWTLWLHQLQRTP